MEDGMKKLAFLIIIAALMLSVVPTAFADPGDPDFTPDDDTATGTLNVSGLGYAIDLSDFSKTIVLNGRDNFGYVNDFGTDWIATDMSGSGDGWNLAIKATDFSCISGACKEALGAGTDWTLPLVYNADEHQGNTYRDVPMDTISFRMPAADITWVDGQWGDGDLAPVPNNGYALSGDNIPANYKELTGEYQQFVTAAENEGMGQYALDPDFQIWIPAEMYAGIYSTTITVQISTGPTYVAP